MIKSHLCKMLNKFKTNRYKQEQSEKKDKLLTKIIERRHRSQSPLKLDNVLIKLN